MKRIREISPSKVLVIFFLLAFVFFAQMVWWIIFQVYQAQRTQSFFTSTVISERDLAIDLLNSHYEGIYSGGKELASELEGKPSQRGIDDPAVSGMAYCTELSDISDSLYFRFPSGDKDLFVFLYKDYPKEAISKSPHLNYSSALRGEILAPDWIKPEFVQVNQSVLHSIQHDRNRHIKMFLMEGSFFILLIMLGAYAVYMALRHSRRIREQQLLFVHSITHELKIPITSISLFLDTMRRRNYDEKIVSELVPKMKEDVGRLNALIDNILLVRKIADKEVESHPEEIDLSCELGKFIQNIRERVEASGGKLKDSIESGIKIQADLQELIKVWETLLDNSVKYANDGKLEVDINLKQNKDDAQIEFLDNGPGIPEGMEHKIFEPFVRATGQSRKSVPGSGLGLYIAREYIKRSGGEIAIGNAPGGGCLVTMRFERIR